MARNSLIIASAAFGILLAVSGCGMSPGGGDSSGTHSLASSQTNPDVWATLVLGQSNFTKRTANAGAFSGHPNAIGLDRPVGVAIDRSVTPNRIYAADFGNHRVLGWASVDSLYNGVAADKVIGQPNFTSFICNQGQGAPTSKSLCFIQGIAVDLMGNLYVADKGNGRVVVFYTPYEKTAVAGSGDNEADRVIGQTDFNKRGCSNPSISVASASSICFPYGVSVDAAGNVYVADTANNRVLEYDNFIMTDSIADHVFGQPNFSSTKASRGTAGLDFPVHMSVDTEGNLYVVDQGNQRVLEYDTPLTKGRWADRVYGQKDFNSFFVNRTGVTTSANAESLSYPQWVTVDSQGTLYVADRGNSRVLQFEDPLTTDGIADIAYGQHDFSSVGCNRGVTPPNANDRSLCQGWSVDIDALGNVWVADYMNNRVIRFQNPNGPSGLPLVLPPTSLMATGGNGSVSLDWTPSTSDTAVQQHLYRSTVSGGPYTLIMTFDDNTTKNYVDGTVTNGTTYYYVVKAVDSDGNESPGSNQAMATPGAPPSLLPPTDLITTAGDGSVTLDWTPSASSGAVQQLVYRGTTSGGPYTLINTINNNTTMTYLDNTVINGTTYYYIVTAKDASGNESPPSNERMATPGAPAPQDEVTIPSESFHFEESQSGNCWLQNELEFSFEKTPGDKTSGDGGHTIMDIVVSTTVVTMTFQDGYVAQGVFEDKEEANPRHGPYYYAQEYEVLFDCHTMKSHVSAGQAVTIHASGTLSDGHTFSGTGVVITHH